MDLGQQNYCTAYKYTSYTLAIIRAEQPETGNYHSQISDFIDHFSQLFQKVTRLFVMLLNFEVGAMKQSENHSRSRCGTLPMQLWTFTYRQDLVTALQLSAQVGRAARQDEGDEDALAIFTTHNVEAQAGGALVEHDLPGFPVQTVQIVHQLGGVAGLQHLQAWLGGDERWMATLAEVDKNASAVLFSGKDGAHTRLDLHRGMMLYLDHLPQIQLEQRRNTVTC